MFSFGSFGSIDHRVNNSETLALLLVGSIAATPILPSLSSFEVSNTTTIRARQSFAALRTGCFVVLRLCLYSLLLWSSILCIASTTHRPFIYFRF